MINLYNQLNNSRLEGDSAPKIINKKTKFEDYVDPTNEFTSQELKYSLWYVKHEVLLYKLFVAGLIVFITITWIFSVWRWADYAIFGWQADQQLQQQLAAPYSYVGVHQHFAPQPLNILNTQILAGGANKYDLVSEVVNTNNRWLVKFQYYFVLEGQKTPAQTTWLLPGEARPLAYLGLENVNYGGALSLVIENVAWQRISGKAVSDTAAWQAERLNFVIDKFAFSRAGSGDELNANAVRFSFTNASPYSYVEPVFYVGLFSGGNVVALMPMRFDKFISLEVKEVDLRNFVPNLQVDDIKIFPIINVYDKNVYLAPPQ